MTTKAIFNRDYDHDLQSIQEARQLVKACYRAQQEFLVFNQEEVDRVCAAMADAAYREAERLGRIAFEETTYGVPAHKTLKNQFASKKVWESIKDVKTVGVISCDNVRKLCYIGWPMGVIAALIPSTNPTSTIIYNILIAVKARNGIVISPHPAAIKCSLETTRVIAEAAEAAGAPAGLVSCMSKVSLPGTQELMKHEYTSLILATGGTAMVKAAHSVGKPAYGVGPGNVPCYVDRSADVSKAAYYITSSKAFDYSVICSTEQTVVADRPIAGQLAAEMQRWGAYFVNQAEAEALAKLLFLPDGAINARAVGQSPQKLGEMAGIQVPASAKVLVARVDRVGKEEPLSREKLTTVLGWCEADGWEAGCERCIELIQYGGAGHSLVMHASDENVIMQFGLEKPVFRIVVNAMGTLGAIGLTTNLVPALTLGPGGIGGAITGDNITTTHLLNIKRLAYEVVPPPAAAMVDAGQPIPVTVAGLSSAQVEEIVQAIVREVQRARG